MVCSKFVAKVMAKAARLSAGVPRAFVNWETQLLGPFRYGVSAEAVHFQHETFEGGSRIVFRLSGTGTEGARDDRRSLDHQAG